MSSSFLHAGSTRVQVGISNTLRRTRLGQSGPGIVSQESLLAGQDRVATSQNEFAFSKAEEHIYARAPRVGVGTAYCLAWFPQPASVPPGDPQWPRLPRRLVLASSATPPARRASLMPCPSEPAVAESVFRSGKRRLLKLPTEHVAVELGQRLRLVGGTLKVTMRLLAMMLSL